SHITGLASQYPLQISNLSSIQFRRPSATRSLTQHHRVPFLRISPPSRPPFVERLRVNPPLGSSSFHRPLAIRRASDDHNETPLNDEFRLEVPGSHSRHRRW